MWSHMKYIYAVYREKSFSKAARKLHVSQPWLSTTVKKVEQKVQLPLFNRSTTPISLTEAGEYYIENVEKIMAIEEEMSQRFSELASFSTMQLNIGSSMFFCTYVLPALLNDFKDQYPQITLTFSEGSSAMLTDRLMEGKLDFLLEAETPNKNLLHSIVWATEEIVLAVPAKYPINQDLKDYGYTFEEFLARNEKGRSKPPVPLTAFSDENFMTLKQGNDIFKRSMAICRNANFTPKISLYLTQMMTAYYLVCEDRGITFLRSTIPEYVAHTDSVVFYQLEDKLAIRNIYLSYPKKRSSPVQQKLIDFMRGQGLVPDKFDSICRFTGGPNHEK